MCAGIGKWSVLGRRLSRFPSKGGREGGVENCEQMESFRGKGFLNPFSKKAEKLSSYLLIPQGRKIQRKHVVVIWWFIPPSSWRQQQCCQSGFPLVRWNMMPSSSSLRWEMAYELPAHVYKSILWARSLFQSGEICTEMCVDSSRLENFSQSTLLLTPLKFLLRLVFLFFCTASSWFNHSCISKG